MLQFLRIKITIFLWTENIFKCIATLSQKSEVYALTISGSSLLISGHRDGTIQIMNQTSFVVLQILKEHSYDVYCSFLLSSNS